MHDPFRLDGRTVVITGASRGIGAATARAVAAAGGGCVLVARSQEAIERLAAELPGPAAAVAGDVADPETADRAAEAGERLGGLWGMVHNAGINPYYHPLAATGISEWDEVMRA